MARSHVINMSIFAYFSLSEEEAEYVFIKSIYLLMTFNYGVLYWTRQRSFARPHRRTDMSWAAAAYSGSVWETPYRPCVWGFPYFRLLDLIYCTVVYGISHNTKMLPYKRPVDCLFSTYTQTSKMLPGEAFLFWGAREALLLGPTTSGGTHTHGPLRRNHGFPWTVARFFLIAPNWLSTRISNGRGVCRVVSSNHYSGWIRSSRQHKWQA